MAESKVSAERRMITLPDAAVRLRLSWSQAYGALLSGQLQGERRGRRWFVSEGSVTRLLTANSREATERGRVHSRSTGPYEPAPNQ
jgi:hypothetical protein